MALCLHGCPPDLEIESLRLDFKPKILKKKTLSRYADQIRSEGEKEKHTATQIRSEGEKQRTSPLDVGRREPQATWVAGQFLVMPRAPGSLISIFSPSLFLVFFSFFFFFSLGFSSDALVFGLSWSYF